MYSGDIWARSMRTPEATSAFRMPGSVRARRMSWISGPWSVPRSLQTVGWKQESRLQRASAAGLGVVGGPGVGAESLATWGVAARSLVEAGFRFGRRPRHRLNVGRGPAD